MRPFHRYADLRRQLLGRPINATVGAVFNFMTESFTSRQPSNKLNRRTTTISTGPQ